MAYQINKTDGTIVATVADGQVDDLSTDLTLIGKNYSGFGEALNENLVKILENFADAARPTHPIRGQLWFDTAESRLKVYNGAEFIPVSSATISGTQPLTLGIGDLWFNSSDKQLYFYDGTNTILLGPAYSQSQGISGLKVASVLDSLNQTRVITYLYNNGILLGIFAKDSFTPKVSIPGFIGSIVPGFNAGTIENFKFNVTATNAEKLGGVDATTYVRKDTSNQIQGQVRINTDLGLVVGAGGQGNFQVSGGNVKITNSASDKEILLVGKRGEAEENALRIQAGDRIVSIYEGQLSSQVNIGGSVTIAGDLRVEGTTVTIDASTLTIEDKNIILAKQTGETPTDLNASTGGVIIQGATSHIFLWADASGLPSTSNSTEASEGGYNDQWPELAPSAWNSSEHINLASGKEFKINGIPVLTGNSLGLGITNIPGVTSFGTLSILNVGPASINTLRLQNNIISTVRDNLDIQLDPNGTGNIAVQGNARITGVGTPTSAQDAANKTYVDSTIRTRPIIVSVTISATETSITNTYISQYVLSNVAPVAEYDNNTYARVYVTYIANAAELLDINTPLNAGISRETVLKSPSGTSNVVTAISIADQVLPAQSIYTTREVRTFRIITGVWQFVPGSVVSLP